MLDQVTSNLRFWRFLIPKCDGCGVDAPMTGREYIIANMNTTIRPGRNCDAIAPTTVHTVSKGAILNVIMMYLGIIETITITGRDSHASCPVSANYQMVNVLV